MAWYEDQPIVTEGFDTTTMLNVLQVWLPINFHTGTVHPVHEQKLFVELTPQQKKMLGASTEEVVVSTYKLTAKNRDTLRNILDASADSELGFFSASIGVGLKIALPSGWVTSAVTLAVKTLVGYLLRDNATKHKASYLSANLAEGGKLCECWHIMDMGGGNVFFHRTIQYEVNAGTELRQFVICSTRYALKS